MACSTIAPHARRVAAQSSSVAPVVITSSTNTQRSSLMELKQRKRPRAASRAVRARPRCASPATCERTHRTLAPQRFAANCASNCAPSKPRTAFRSFVVGTGTRIMLGSHKAASRPPRADPTSRRPSFRARIARRTPPSYSASASTASVSVDARSAAASGKHASQIPPPMRLHPPHCGGKRNSMSCSNMRRYHDGPYFEKVASNSRVLRWRRRRRSVLPHPQRDNSCRRWSRERAYLRRCSRLPTESSVGCGRLSRR